MKIEVGGEYVTRDGRRVEVLRVGVNAGWSVLALVTEENGRQFVLGLDSEGRTTATSEPFIIPVPKKHTRRIWLVHWKCGGSNSLERECNAAYLAEHGRNILAITGPHEITFTEGDGLQREGE